MDEYYIWIEAEVWPLGEWTPIDCNSDVLVSLKKGGEWLATFITYKNIATLTEKNKYSGECLHGKYLWAKDMVLVDEITRERVEEVVKHLFASGEFENVFRVNDE